MGARLNRIGAVSRVEGLQLLRDRASLVLIFLLPIFQILLYGYAINLEPKHVVMAMATDEPRRNIRKGSTLNAGPELATLCDIAE